MSEFGSNESFKDAVTSESYYNIADKKSNKIVGNSNGVLNIRNFNQENNNYNNVVNNNENTSIEGESNEFINENTNLSDSDHNDKENNDIEATPPVNITPENGGDDTIENTNEKGEEPTEITNTNTNTNNEDNPFENNNYEINNEENNNEEVDNNEDEDSNNDEDNNDEDSNSEDSNEEEVEQKENNKEENTQQAGTTPDPGEEDNKKDTVEKVNETVAEETAETTENNEDIPAIVIDKEEGKEEVDEEGGENEDEEEKREDLANNLEVKNEFHDIFNKDLSESGDATELKRTLSNLYDKIRILSRENINEEQDVSNVESPSYPASSTYPQNSSSNPASPESPMSFNSPIFPISPSDDINKYYQSFSGTLQRIKPMAVPSAELCATINNRYQNNINIQEFFDRLEKITAQNAYAINNSLSSLVNLVHDSTNNIYSSNNNIHGSQNGSFNESFHNSTHGSRDDIVAKSDALKNPKKLLNQGDAGLNKNFRSYFKFAKKKIRHNSEAFISNITTNTIPIPNIVVPPVPSIDELPQRDPLSLGLYYHHRGQYDIADYYFTLASVDNNAIGLYLHGMYLKYGYGISGCSPELGFQYLLKSAEASIQSIPTVNKGNTRVASTDYNNMKGKEDGKVQKTTLNDEIEDDNELVAEKMLMKTNIANMLTKLTDEEFETWIVRCIVSLPIYEIGQSFLHGHGVPKSHSKAVYCFNVAAYMGDADAQMALARCYKHGIGVKKTRKMAAMWFRKAHANGKCIFGESWVWKKKYN